MSISKSNNLRREVNQFLSDFKNLMDEKPVSFSRHRKNLQTIKRLGLTEKNRIDYLYALTPENYSKGPIPDKYHPGNYWEFGIEIDSNPIYIKVKIATNDSGDEWPVCYSFHDPEFPMSFPLR